MCHFPTAEHICSWAGLSPGNNESAGKRKSTAISKGNPYIKSMLCEVAWAIAAHKEIYLSQWYWRLKQKRGAKRAIIALARKLLVLIYTMLKSGSFYDESCFEQRRLQCERKRASRMVQELTRLGYSVEKPFARLRLRFPWRLSISPVFIAIIFYEPLTTVCQGALLVVFS